MYESRNEPLLHPAHFRRRLFLHAGYALLLVGATLLVGALGHKLFGGHDWHDALMNAAFVIGGIGTYVMPETSGGKIFVSIRGTHIDERPHKRPSVS